MGNNAAKRLGIVDLWRFVFSIVIMLSHMYYIIPGIDAKGRLYEGGAIYVEFFFILSGYFAAKYIFGGRHNANNLSPGIEESEQTDFVKLSLIYVGNKFKRIIPYMWASVIWMFIVKTLKIESHFIRNFIYFAEKAVCSMLLITSTGFGSTSTVKTDSLNPPMWYLSAMFLALPAVCMLLMNRKTRNVYAYYLVWILPLCWYGSHPGIVIREAFPSDIFRAFCSLSLGVLVYQVSVWLKRKDFSKTSKAALTALELACVAATLLFSIQWFDWNALIVILFVIMTSIMLSGKSMTARIRGKFFDYLGSLSLIIYLFHWPIFQILRYIKVNSITQGYVFYSVATIIFSVAILGMGTLISKIIKSIKITNTA